MRLDSSICVIICLFIAITTGYSQQTIHDAAKQGNLADVKRHLQEGANVNARDETGRTPLMRAAGNGHLDVVKFLVEKDADVNAKNEDGRTALYWATCAGNRDVVAFLKPLVMTFWDDVHKVRPDGRKVAATIEFREWAAKQSPVVNEMLTSEDIDVAVAILDAYKESIAKEGRHTNAANGNIYWTNMPIDKLKSMAKQGNAGAQCHLAFRYYKGIGVSKDNNMAFKWMTKLDHNDYWGLNLLRLMYEGVGIPKDHIQAAQWMTNNFANNQIVKTISEAAEQGCSISQYYMGEHYADVKKNNVEAMKWYMKAAEQGLAEAQYELGGFYNFGLKLPTNYVEAAKWYGKAADQGHGDAQIALAYLYQNGQGVPKDSLTAMKWFRKAAENGNDEAEYEIGLMYATGDGVPKDIVEASRWIASTRSQCMLARDFGEGTKDVIKDPKSAVEWYRIAAEKGDASAQICLGYKYAEGNGIAQNNLEAIKWWRKAAEQGKQEAQFRLGVWYYYEKDGVQQDYKEAHKWFSKTVESVNNKSDVSVAWAAEAQVHLGILYFEGKGVPKDYKEAYKWTRRAAEYGDNFAQYNLGRLYYFGQGTPQDYVQAYTWWNIAASDGMTNAMRDRDKLASQMTPQQISEAQSRSAVFVPKKSLDKSELPPSLNTKDIPRKGSGTGFFITSNGYFITARHVIAEADNIIIKTATELIPAKVVKEDEANDVAILKVEGQFKALTLVSTKSVRLGAPVFTIGFPNIELQGFNPKLTKGDISSLTGIGDDPRHFQISSPVQPGNSGGALVSMDGNVIGMVVMRLNDANTIKTTGMIPQNVNYALKTSYILPLLETLQAIAEQQKTTNITAACKYDDIVKEVESATAIVLVY